MAVGRKECAGCEDLRVRLDSFIELFKLSTCQPRALRCNCGLLATTKAITKHPVGGHETYLLCDYCTPPVPYRDGALTEIAVSDLEIPGDLAKYRSINAAIKGQ